MSLIGRRIGETHFKLPRHLHRLNEAKQIVRYGFSVRQYVKILAFFHTGQRGYHDIPGEISAAAPRDDPGVKSLLHDTADCLCIQVMELYGLARRKMRLLHTELGYRVGYEF